MSFATAFCNRSPFKTLFAARGSYVHELEHEAGAVKILDMASVVVGIVVISVESTVALATNVGIVDVILKLYLRGSSIGCCRREKQKQSSAPKSKGIYFGCLVYFGRQFRIDLSFS